jgi:hypothetical protein
MDCRSPWPRGLRRRFAAARIPPGAWLFVCCGCCVLSGRGLCYELITRPEESYRLWCVVVCDLETSTMRRPLPALGRSATEKKNLDYVFCFQTVTFPTTHLFDRSFFSYLSDVPTMVSSHMSSSVSQSMLFIVSVILDNYLMPWLRDHEDCIMICPRSRTHCHIQVEVPAFLNAVVPGKWIGLMRSIPYTARSPVVHL